ncbi:MAG: AI-2E family transporter, partial [Bdellovibrionales bacterium]|nr:AI-2E family transporter [Bdellovibrionales bacterium]
MLRNAFTVLLLGLFVWVCFPLITPVAMGGVFALLFFPWFVKLEKKKVPSALAAAIITAAFSVLVLLPISVLIVTALKTGVYEFRAIQQQWSGVSALGPGSLDDGTWMSRLGRHHFVVSAVERLSKFFPVSSEELLATTIDVLKVVG